MTQELEVVEIDVYHSKYSDLPVCRAIFITPDKKKLYREAQRELAVIAKAESISGANIRYLLDKAAQRSGSKLLEVTPLRITLSEL